MKTGTKYLFKIGILLLLGIILPSLVRGQIEVVSKTGSACNTCTGSIKIKPIQGAATPLRVRITDSRNVLQVVENLIGEYEVTGVCPGKLNVSVQSMRLVGCEEIHIIDDPNFSIPGNGQGGFEIVVTSVKNALFPYDPNDPGTQDGAVTVTTNVSGNYTYSWSNGRTGNAINAIPAGIYTVTATAESGCTAVKEITIGACNDYIEYPDQDGYLTREPISIAENFEVNIIGGIIPAGQSQITLTATVKRSGDQSFGSIPNGYMVHWTDRVGNVLGYGDVLTLSTANIQFQSPIIAKVSNGCLERIKSESIIQGCGIETPLTLVNKFIYSLASSCMVNNTDSKSGKIIFNVLPSSLSGPNPLKIWVDNILVTANSSSSSGFVEARNLSTGNHNIKININECDYNFTVNLDASVAKYTWAGFRNDKCYYNLLCGDRLQTINVNPVKSYEDSFEGRKCTFNNICNFDGVSRNVGSGEDDYKEANAGVYLQILRNARRNPPSGVSLSFINNMIGKTENLKPCNHVKFCPVTLKKISHDSPLEFLFVKNAIISCYNNTYNLTCNGNNPEDLLLQVGGVADEDCCYDGDPKTKDFDTYSLKFLLHWYRNLNKTQFYRDKPRFQGSELENTLLQYLNSNDSRVNCATLEVCFRDYRVRSFDIEDIQCDISTKVVIGKTDDAIITAQSCSEFDDGIYICKKISNLLGYRLDTKRFPSSGSGIGIYVFKPDETPEQRFSGQTNSKESLTNSDTSEVRYRYFMDSTRVEEFKNFYPITSEQIICPKAIVKVANSANTLYDYSHAIDEVEKAAFPNVLYKVEDWDTDESSSIHRLSEKEYALNYVSPSKAWYSPISADSLASIDFLGMKDSFSLVGGHFWGSLKYNDSIISKRTDVSTLFLMKTNPLGAIVGTHFVEAIDTNYQPLFAKDKHGQTIISMRAKGKWLRLDGVNFELVSAGAELLIKVDSAFNMSILKQISLNAQSRILDLAISSNGNNFACSISKVNTVIDEQSVMTASLGSKFAILSFSADGSPLWQRIWSGDSINTDKTALAFGKNSDLFAGLTFSGSIVSLSDSLSSRGGYDIALVKFQQNGTTNSSYSYGTADDENVSQLLYDQQVLFFGGEISGNTKIREIGKYHFVNFTPFNDRAYVSYIPDTLPAPPTGELLQLDDTKVLVKTPAKTTKNLLKVFPNPFMDNLKTEFQLESAGSMRILMLNELGKVVQSQNFEGYRGSNSVNLSTRGLPPGVYIIQVVDSTGQMFGVEKVVKI